MPSFTKILHFLLSAKFTAVSVGVLGFCMSIKWSKTTLECARRGSGFFNGTATITLELFSGNLVRSSCPLFGGSDDFTGAIAFVYIVGHETKTICMANYNQRMIPKLAETGVTPVALYIVVLCLLVLCLLFSACSILISLYNSVSNPYETYMGPVGVYTCSSLSACLSVVALIIFVVNIHVTSMAEDLVLNFSEDIDLRNKSSEMLLGYYLVILYTVLSLAAIVLIYMYDHAAYRQRKEQQRPTEDAPKEIMMY